MSLGSCHSSLQQLSRLAGRLTMDDRLLALAEVINSAHPSKFCMWILCTRYNQLTQLLHSLLHPPTTSPSPTLPPFPFSPYLSIPSLTLPSPHSFTLPHSTPFSLTHSLPPLSLSCSLPLLPSDMLYTTDGSTALHVYKQKLGGKLLRRRQDEQQTAEGVATDGVPPSSSSHTRRGWMKAKRKVKIISDLQTATKRDLDTTVSLRYSTNSHCPTSQPKYMKSQKIPESGWLPPKLMSFSERFWPFYQVIYWLHIEGSLVYKHITLNDIQTISRYWSYPLPVLRPPLPSIQSC